MRLFVLFRALLLCVSIRASIYTNYYEKYTLYIGDTQNESTNQYEAIPAHLAPCRSGYVCLMAEHGGVNAASGDMSPDLSEKPTYGPNAGTAANMAAQANAAQRRARVFDLRVAGYSFRQIAESQGVSCATVHKDWNVVLAEHAPPQESIEQQRELEVARADDGIARCNVALETAKDHEQRMRILEARLRFQQHRAKLLGLYAPVQIQVEGTVGVEVDGSLAVTALDWARALQLKALDEEVRKLLPAASISAPLTNESDVVDAEVVPT